jgi:dTDP-4-amino-4,6-dideoxygalactose transaminase/bifunctional N-acetylglucosamine-1-phosphate-uridyltransferase/glucosamine-1-phosphate-acetyltransferase GlmU-like protein/GNAT superfamily N-acetyltransferase
MQIIIPMSGIGKRFIDAGYEDPKPLIKVDGKPMIQHIVNLFPGETDITFICNDLHLKETNMREVLNKISPNCKIYEVPVNNRHGPVHAVSQIFDNIRDNDEVIVSYCDYGTWWSYDKFLTDTRGRDADGAVACYKGFHPHMLGTDNYAFLQEIENNSRLMKAIQEKKPFTNDRMNEYASNGTYYFKSGIIVKKYFQRLMDLEMKVNNEYYVSMVYNLMVEDKLQVNIFEIDHMLQWGTPYDLEVYNSWSNYFSNIINKQEKFVDRLGITTILPLAGEGSRFSKVGYKDPKPLIPVNGLPMVVQAIKCLPQSSNNIFICRKKHLDEYPLEEKLKDSYPNSQIFGIEGLTEGQACTTELGIEKGDIDLDKPILITACDNGAYYDMGKYQRLVDDEEVDVIVWSFKDNPTSKNNRDMYAWLETDEENNILHVSCKKFIEGRHDIKRSHCIIGTMFFRKARYFIDGLKRNYEENIRSNGEFYVDDVLNQNIKSGLKVKSFVVDNYICWGTPDDYKTYLYWKRFFNKCWWHPYNEKLDITYHKNKVSIYEPNIKEYSTSALNAIKSGWISNHGSNVSKATNMLKKIFNIPYCILMANGTCATHCLFLALKYKYPDVKKIYVPNNCYIAAWNCALMEYNLDQLQVMKMDIKSWNILTDEEYIRSLDKDSAILIVHNLGNVINVPRLKKIRPDLIFIEDNCEGFLGKYENYFSGMSSSSLCSSCSFYGNKIITTGEGGAFFTHDKNVYDYIKLVYSQGMSNIRYLHNVHAYNYRMTNIEAGFLCDQLSDIDNIVNNKYKIFERYEKLLRWSIKGGYIKLMNKEINTKSSPWIFPLRIMNDQKSINDKTDFFSSYNIDIRPFFYPINKHHHLSQIKNNDIVSDILHKEIIMIPSSPNISENDMNDVVTTIYKYLFWINNINLININYLNSDEYYNKYLSKIKDNYFRYFDKRDITCLNDHVHTIILLNNDNNFVGYAHIDFENRYWLGIYIVEDFRGKGIGSLLLQYLLYIKEILQIDRLYLTVDKDNIVAKKMYEKYDFIITNSNDKYNIMLNEK